MEQPQQVSGRARAGKTAPAAPPRGAGCPVGARNSAPSGTPPRGEKRAPQRGGLPRPERRPHAGRGSSVRALSGREEGEALANPPTQTRHMLPPPRQAQGGQEVSGGAARAARVLPPQRKWRPRRRKKSMPHRKHNLFFVPAQAGTTRRGRRRSRSQGPRGRGRRPRGLHPHGRCLRPAGARSPT